MTTRSVIVAVLGLIHGTIILGFFNLIAMLVQLDVARDLKLHELMRLADPNVQPPDREAELSVVQSNIPNVFTALVSLVCLLTVFGSLK